MLPVRPPVACSCRGICVSTPSSAAVSVYQTVFDDAYPLRQFSVGSVELSPAPVVSIVLVNGKLVIGVAAEHRSFAGNVPLTELMMISTLVTGAPAWIVIGVAIVGSSGGLLAASLGPFRNSATGTAAGGLSGPTREPPVKARSMASISTV